VGIYYMTLSFVAR